MKLNIAHHPFSANIGLRKSQTAGDCNEYSENTIQIGLVQTMESTLSDHIIWIMLQLISSTFISVSFFLLMISLGMWFIVFHPSLSIQSHNAFLP